MIDTLVLGNAAEAPSFAAVNPQGTKVYVTEYNAGRVAVIDTATKAVTFTEFLGAKLTGVAVHPDGSRVYVVCACGTLFVLDGATNALVAQVPVPSDSHTVGQFVGPAVSRNPVVVIPGIMGSTLVTNDGTNTLVWFPPPASDPPFPAKKDKINGLLDKLQLNQDGSDTTPIRNVGVLESVTCWDPRESPPTRTVPVYEGLIQALQANGYVKEESLFVFQYDWRKDLMGLVENPTYGLAQYIGYVLGKAGAKKVDIVAHSMGGLLAKWYAVKWPENVGTLILIGTPHLGTPEAFFRLRYGWVDLGVNWGCGISAEETEKIGVNWPAAYHLLPSAKYFDVIHQGANPRDGYFEEARDIDNDGMAKGVIEDYAHMKALLYGVTFSFYDYYRPFNSPFIEAAESFHSVVDGWSVPQIPMFLIVGEGKDTKAQIIEYEVPGVLCPFSISFLPCPGFTWTDANGDGTVVSESARDGAGLVPGKIYAINEEHMKLPSNECVTKLVRTLCKVRILEAFQVAASQIVSS